MQLQRHNPWSIFTPPTTPWPQFTVENTDEATLLTADVPGMGEADIEITVATPDLIVKGERQSGRRPGSFERRFRIGDALDPDRVSATVANGELVIRLEKPAKPAPRKIPLTSR